MSWQGLTPITAHLQRLCAIKGIHLYYQCPGRGLHLLQHTYSGSVLSRAYTYTTNVLAGAYTYYSTPTAALCYQGHKLILPMSWQGLTPITAHLQRLCAIKGI